MNLTEDTAADLVDAYIRDHLDEDTAAAAAQIGDGRGIVTCAGGVKYLPCAYVLVRQLRMIGCELPIQIWHLGPAEMPSGFRDLVAPLNVATVDAREVQETYPHARLHGWESKPYAIQHCPFREVLFLDADNFPVVDPTPFFDWPEYTAAGAVAWPDYGRLAPTRKAWEIFGRIPYRDEPEWESGQLLIDKAKHLRVLVLIHWYMQNSNNFYFRHVHGDKEVFHLAWRKASAPYAMPPRGIDTLPGTMCQHDFKHRRIFQHRNLRKWNLFQNSETKDFCGESDAMGYLQDLRAVWSPAADTLASPGDAAEIVATAGQYTYHRHGYDRRPITLAPDGRITEGRAKCETYWTIRDGHLHIAGESGQLIMRLFRDGSSWRGNWLHHEKMPVSLIPSKTA